VNRLSENRPDHGGEQATNHNRPPALRAKPIWRGLPVPTGCGQGRRWRGSGGRISRLAHRLMMLRGKLEKKAQKR